MKLQEANQDHLVLEVMRLQEVNQDLLALEVMRLQEANQDHLALEVMNHQGHLLREEDSTEEAHLEEVVVEVEEVNFYLFFKSKNIK